MSIRRCRYSPESHCWSCATCSEWTVDEKAYLTERSPSFIRGHVNTVRADARGNAPSSSFRFSTYALSVNGQEMTMRADGFIVFVTVKRSMSSAFEQSMIFWMSLLISSRTASLTSHAPVSSSTKRSTCPRLREHPSPVQSCRCPSSQSESRDEPVDFSVPESVDWRKARLPIFPCPQRRLLISL